jgi:acetylornithine deacetylase/succinyl-diaminopimelate desuccinylase-like protein
VDVIDLLVELVGIESTNTTLEPDGPGEAAIAARLAELLDRLGLTVSTREVAPGRPNVLGTLPGNPAWPALLFEAHLDTVPAPAGGIPVRRDGDRLTGRGTCDCKGALAAMVVALGRIAAVDPAARPTVLLAGAVDEESSMTGSAALLGTLAATDVSIGGAVIAEPTSLVPVRAHHGVVRAALTASGRSAHAAKAHLGVNAVNAMARTITALDEQVGRRLAAVAHPLAGPALLNATVIRGGTAPNIVPDHCEVILDRRTPPGTTPDAVVAEIEAVLAERRAAGDDVHLGEPFVALPGVETDAGEPVVVAAERAASAALDRPVTAGGVPFATDACNLLGSGGIPCVVLGPGSIDYAHTADEWVPLSEVVAAVDVYEAIARSFVPAGTPSS